MSSSETPGPGTAVRTAGRTDADRIVAVLTLAFAGDPGARWLYPDATQYMTCFPRFIGAFGGKAFEHDGAFCVGDWCGAALWLPPGAQPDEAALIALLQESVPGERQAEVYAMLEQMNAFHPQEPHWYLPLIGVDPSRQSRGLGSILLGHMISVCDRQGAPAYLEASSPRNIALYERHGFEAIGAMQVGDSPTIVPMRRRPR